MALSFGSLTPASLSLNNVPFSFGTTVDTTDDFRAARTRNETYKAPTKATPKLSFPSVASYKDPFMSGNSLSFPKGIIPAGKTTKSTGLLSGASDWLKLASFGQSLTDTRSNPTVYDDGILRAGRAIESTPELYTADISGGTSTLDGLKNMAKGILANIGSKGDGDLVATEVAYGGNQSGGINPLYIAGAAIAAGALYYVASK